MCSLVAACTGGDDEIATDDIEAAEDGKADAATELRVRAGDTTLWVDRVLERRGDLLVLHGRTSRNITSGNAFVFDDVYGDFTQPTARTFEISWPDSTLRGVVDGVNLFTSLGFKQSSGRPDSMTSRVIVRPRLGAIAGSSSLALTAELTPVMVAGRTLYRIKGRSTSPISALETTAGLARLVDPNHFEIDLDFDQLLAQTAIGKRLVVTAQLAAGPAMIRGTLGLAVKRLGLTSGDVETVYPSPICTPDRLACLQLLPDASLDLSMCGPALEVSRCTGQVGVFVDAPMIDATLATVDVRLADADFTSDAKALVGADHAAAFAVALRQRISTRLATDQGLWLVTPAARQLVIGSDVDGSIDAAYARPLGLVGSHTAIPKDVAAARQVAADSLLAYLATQDYVHSEFGRSLDQLTKEFRAQHVQSLREFRETNTSETFPNAPKIDIYIGQWLGTHTEVSIDRTTGTMTNVLVELD